MKVLRISELCDLLKVGRTTIYDWRKRDPDFPKPIRLGPNSVAFLEEDIKGWLERRKEQAA